MTVHIAFWLLQHFIKYGHLHITIINDKGDDTRYLAVGRYSGPEVRIILADPATLWRIVRKPDLAFGEAYMDGTLVIERDDLDSLMHFLLRNIGHWNQSTLGRLSQWYYRTLSRLTLRNKPAQAQENVAHHYDLSDALFSSFLDPLRQYSCAYYDQPDTDLASAQITKLARIAAKLDLRYGDRVLDIGSGWGGLALALDACVPDLEFTGITLSQEQQAYATAWARNNKASSRVQFALRDYRHQTGQFNKIVSVGMLEHVGPGNYATYFRTIKRLLIADGVALVHSIAVYCDPKPVNRWISRYIFPGGYLPSLEQVIAAATESGLKILDMEVMRMHYAHTLRDWRTNFIANGADLGTEYDDQFRRMWLFYLAGCEYFFKCQHGMVIQLLVAHDDMAVPSNRRYIGAQQDRFKDILCSKTNSGKTPPSPT